MRSNPCPRQESESPHLWRVELSNEQSLLQSRFGKNAVEFLGFLAQLAHEYSGRPCIVVLDNASYHTAVVVQKFLAELSTRFEVVWLPPYCPKLNDIERIWKYVKGASLANYDFGNVTNLRQAITEVFDEINSNVKSDLTLRFRDPLSKDLLKVA